MKMPTNVLSKILILPHKHIHDFYFIIQFNEHADTLIAMVKRQTLTIYVFPQRSETEMANTKNDSNYKK